RRRETPRCELCAALIGRPHAHVVEIDKGTLACACAACAVLFRDGTRWRTVPSEVKKVAAPRLDIPVKLAFVVRRKDSWTAYLPSPGGAVETAISPLSAALQPDVEALLLNGDECFVVPIDVAYELTAVVRKNWRGFSGGGAFDAVEEFFAQLRRRAR